MAQTVNVDFRVDADPKKSIPFEVSVDPFYSESNLRYLERVKRDIDEGRAHLKEHELIEGNN